MRMMPEFDDRLLELRRDFEKALDLLHRAELHHALDAGAIVPAAIKDHDLAASRKMPHVSLDVHLRLFPVGRRGQRDDAENARADAFGDRLDDPALAGAVAALEHDADLKAFGDDPELQFHEFSMQPGQFALVTLVVEFLPPFRAFFILGLAASALAFCRTHASLPCLSFTSWARLPSKASEGLDIGQRRDGASPSLPDRETAEAVAALASGRTR